MNNKVKNRIFLSLFTIIYLISLYFFYFKYVPIVKPFQIILVPILFSVFLITIFYVKWGTLLFIFSFPLINNLPYFFGISENIPHAPTALVLFLFFFLGWLVHNILYKPEYSIKHPILKPLILFSILIFISGIITIFRYSNFYPFLSDYVYELVTNVNGVSAGGAIMSSIFNSLNYLTGFAFFIILLTTVKSNEFIKKIFVILLISTSISILFGLFQQFHDISIGNTFIRIKQNTLNATFKDPNSFGVYLAVIIPLFLGGILAFRKFMKTALFIAIISAFLVLPSTGSISGLLGLSISFVILTLF